MIIENSQKELESVKKGSFIFGRSLSNIMIKQRLHNNQIIIPEPITDAIHILLLKGFKFI